MTTLILQLEEEREGGEDKSWVEGINLAISIGAFMVFARRFKQLKTLQEKFVEVFMYQYLGLWYLFLNLL
tara:strand:+ start:8631 stop:8840 length:210 start_codon:yes stop_codon:yes gene_type:complete